MDSKIPCLANGYSVIFPKDGNPRRRSSGGSRGGKSKVSQGMGLIYDDIDPVMPSDISKIYKVSEPMSYFPKGHHALNRSLPTDHWTKMKLAHYSKAKNSADETLQYGMFLDNCVDKKSSGWVAFDLSPEERDIMEKPNMNSILQTCYDTRFQDRWKERSWPPLTHHNKKFGTIGGKKPAPRDHDLCWFSNGLVDKYLNKRLWKQDESMDIYDPEKIVKIEIPTIHGTQFYPLPKIPVTDSKDSPDSTKSRKNRIRSNILHAETARNGDATLTFEYDGRRYLMVPKRTDPNKRALKSKFNKIAREEAQAWGSEEDPACKQAQSYCARQNCKRNNWVSG